MYLQRQTIKLFFVTRRHENHRDANPYRRQLRLQVNAGHAAKVWINDQTIEPRMLRVGDSVGFSFITSGQTVVYALTEKKSPFRDSGRMSSTLSHYTSGEHLGFDFKRPPLF